MLDPYFILSLRSYGYIALSIIGFVGFIMFFYISHPNNGINKGFGLCLLALSFLSAMVTTTGLAASSSQNLSPEQLAFYLPYWTRETIAVWGLCMTVIALGIYLMRHKDD